MAHRALAAPAPPGSEMDAVLHRQRTDRSRRKLTHRADIAGLPDGVMVRLAGGPGLLIAGRVRPWSLRGYGAPLRAGPGQAEVLTPPSIVAAFAAGYQPLVHASALTVPPLPGAPPRVRICGPGARRADLEPPRIGRVVAGPGFDHRHGP